MDVGGLRKLNLGTESSLLLWVRERSVPDTQMGGHLYSYEAMGFGCEVGWRRPPYDMTYSTFFVRSRCWMLSAPLSPAWIVAVYLPARIVAVWGQGPTPNSPHEVIHDRQMHKYITTPISPSCKVAEKCTRAR